MTKLGVVRMRSGRPDEAMRLFREAIAREPGNAEALLYLAGALASSGRSADALPFFERAVKADPASTMALNGLGLARLDLGDKAGSGGGLPSNPCGSIRSRTRSRARLPKSARALRGDHRRAGNSAKVRTGDRTSSNGSIGSRGNFLGSDA